MPSVPYYNSIVGTQVQVSGENVGIGTATPAYKLDVNGSGNFSGSVTATSLIKSGGTSSQYLMADGSVSTPSFVSGTGTSGYIPKWNSSSTLNNSPIFANSFYVGVGTSSPMLLLQVEGGNVGFNRNNGSCIFQVGSTATDTLLYVDGTSNDKVGINTTSPSYKLDVNGTFSANSVNVNDQYTFPTGIGSVGDSLVYAGSNQVAWSGVSVGGLTCVSGNLCGDLNLNNYDIVGTGNITIDGNITAEYFYGDLDGVVITECRNGTASTISEGTPVYVSGYYSSNGKPLIAEANAGSSSTMPAIGLLASDLASGAEGHIHVFGLAKNLPSAVTNGFSVGETVYVAAGGGLTNVRPTGVSELVQNMGRVLKTGTNGRILVLGPGRSNDVPNSGHFEQLTVDGQTILAKDGGKVGIGTDTPSPAGGGTSLHIHDTNYPEIKLTNDNTLSTSDDGSIIQVVNSEFRFTNREDGNSISFYAFDSLGTSRQKLILSESSIVVNGAQTNTDFRVAGDADPNVLVVDANNDCVAIGSNSDLNYVKLLVNNSVQAGSKAYHQIWGGTNYGTIGLINASVNSTLSTVNGLYSYMFPTTGGAVSSMYHFRADPPSGVGTISNQAGFYAGAGLTYATNNYGFFGYLPEDTNNYNLYMSSSAKNYLNGNLGIGQTSPNCRLTLGANISGLSNNGISVDMGSVNKPAFTARRGTGNPVFSILPYSSQVYLSAGAYYNGSAWTHDSDDANNCIFTLDPGNGTLWYAGNNSSSINNVASAETLWNADGDWKSRLRSTRSGNNYITGGNFSIGTSSPAAIFHIQKDVTYAGAGTAYGQYTDVNSEITSNGTNYIIGLSIDARKDVNTGVTDAGYIMGADIVGVTEGGGDITASYGVRTYAGMHTAGSGTITNAFGVRSRVLNLGTGTITNGYGLYIDDVAATNGYGIYQIGSGDDNYFAGNVGIGTNDPASTLTVASTNEEGLRIHTFSAPSENFIIGRNTSNGTLVFKGSQSDFSGYEFRSTIGGSSQTVLQTDRLTGAITFNDEFTFPTTDGSADQVLVTNGSGVITWQNQSAGTASATAWGSYNGSTNARNQDYNVSSITDNGGAGRHTINLSITMSSTDYCVVANEYHRTSVTFGTSATITTRSTTSFQIWTGGINGTTNSEFDSPYVAYAVFGS